MDKSNKTEDQQLIQKWFPGDHGCVGGGSIKQSGLSDGALQWMIDSIKKLGLALEIDTRVIPTGVKPDPVAEYKVDPQSIIGKMTQFLGTEIRVVSDDFEDLDESVKKRWHYLEDYRPGNLEKHSHKLNKYVPKN